MTNINFSQFKDAKAIIARAIQLEGEMVKTIGQYGREAARRAVEERKNDKAMKGLNVAERFKAIVAIHAADIKGSDTLARSFKDCLIGFLSADTPVTLVRTKVDPKTKKKVEVEEHTTAGALAETGSKHDLREGAKAAMDANGLGRKSSTRAPRAGGKSATAPIAKTEKPATAIAMTPEQVYRQAIAPIVPRLEEAAFIDMLKAELEKHGLTITKKRGK